MRCSWKTKLAAPIDAQGFGEGEMTWKVPKPGRYRVELSAAGRPAETVEAVATPAERALRLRLPPHAIDPVRVEIIHVPGA